MQVKQHTEAREKLNTEQTERTRAKNATEKEKGKFFDQIEDAHDLSDYLQELTDYLQRYCNASAVYIGKLVSPKKAITDADDDQAHVEDGSEK